MSLPIPEYDRLDATALAALVREGQVTPRELLEAAIARAEARNPTLNAVVENLYDRARERSDHLPEGPLRGVPFLVKDLKLAINGTVTTGSCKLTSGYRPDYTSVLAERYEAAGLQTFGKTNTPEFGIMAITESHFRGPARNPWNTDHTPGGSSGGAAAAVAARIVPIAHAGDGGGSIRIPASHTGLFGLKPTRGRVTMAPKLGEAWHGMVQEHVVARSVRDSALLLDLVDGATPGEPYVAPGKSRPWLDEVGAPTGKLRIAFCREALYANDQDVTCSGAVDDAVVLLRDLGHELVEDRPLLDVEALVRAYFLTVATGVACFVEDAAAFAGVSPSSRHFEPATWLLALIGWRTPAVAIDRARQAMAHAGRVLGAFHQQYDLFVTATVARPPARIGQLAMSRVEELQIAVLRHVAFGRVLDFAIEQMGKGKLAWNPNTQLFNQTGQPAMSVPLHWTPDGLPVGVQFAAAFGREDLLFRVAAQLEQARPWEGRAPDDLRR